VTPIDLPLAFSNMFDATGRRDTSAELRPGGGGVESFDTDAVEDETRSVNQALRGLAHRPSPSYLALELNRIGFEHVYASTDPPNHPDNRFSWLDNLDTARDGALPRSVFAASSAPLERPGLTSLFA
jgi:hypothetical protein